MAKRRRRSNRRSPSKMRRRPCPIAQAGLIDLDYKDVELLKQFITEKGKIIPRRISGLSARNQKHLTRAIKKSRNIALLSFSEGYVPQDVIEAAAE
ncbi:MAG: small subunit ribosomal protein S18 [bacterium]|jgi:small subunit ribosomal protein S18